jgi:hypothetical protein
VALRSSIKAAVVVLLVTLAMVPSALAGGAAGGTRHCGNSNNPDHPWGDLRARRIGCHGARKVANGYSPNSKNPRGFHCTAHKSPVGEGDKVVCKRNHHGKRQRVSFAYGF